MSKAPASLLAVLMALLAPAAARAEPAVIGLARAYLGPQSTLDAIQSIHYVGSLERVDPDHSDKGAERLSLDLTFARPLRQHQVIRGAKMNRTTVLDGYDAWDLLQDNADPRKVRLTWLPPGEIKALRADTWENLFYYRAPPGGAVEDKGPATVDGVDCERVAFTHDPNAVYERFFDRDTGRLVLTVRGTETFRESGEIRVDGVRFPKKIVSTQKTASGKDAVTTVTFDSIVLNEALNPDLFAAPSLVLPKAVPAAGAVPQKK
jgi:hypothetical protein